MRWEDERERARFESKVQKTSSCWVWLGAGAGDGYGMFKARGKELLAHRVAYENLVGRIPPGSVIRHTCDVRRCVNPEHLVAGTQAENVADTVSRERQARGERNGQSRLTAAQVTEVRSLYRPRVMGYGALAARYGISRYAIKLIVHRKTWRHV